MAQSVTFELPALIPGIGHDAQAAEECKFGHVTFMEWHQGIRECVVSSERCFSLLRHASCQ